MDIGNIADDFPTIRKVRYLNNASNAPMPIQAIKAVTDFLLFTSENGPDSNIVTNYINELAAEVRKRIAKIINCDQEEIVFTESTTDGINYVSRGLRLKEGDNIIIGDSQYEHPANYIPWLRLTEKGVILKRLSANNEGVDLAELEEMIDSNTQLIAISHAHFNTGLILPVEEIGKIAKDHCIPFFLDAAQTVGCLPLDLQKIDCDFMAFTGSKWLCGPLGTGIFYCKKESAEKLDPLKSGSESVFVDKGIIYKGMPERMQAGFRNWPGIAGLNASLRYITNVGIDKIRERNMHLANMLREGLEIERVKLYGEGEERTSIVSFSIDGLDSSDVIRRLEENNVILAKRDIARKKVVRASPHFFNQEREIYLTLELIRSMLQ